VKKNKGSPGIDGMTVDELPDHLRAHWSELREQLLSEAYRPSMVKEQLIPKGNGGMRKLGIPTVLDRFIQQALLQVLQPIFDPTSRNAAAASGRGDVLTTQSCKHSASSRKAVASWWTWTWSNSLTA